MSSSQQAAQVHEVACGRRSCSSISVCKLLPPKRILLFQSLLEALPHKASNSLGVYHSESNLIHLPLPPEPNRLLCSSALVFLQRTGRTAILAHSVQEQDVGLELRPEETCIESFSTSSILFCKII